MLLTQRPTRPGTAVATASRQRVCTPQINCCPTSQVLHELSPIDGFAAPGDAYLTASGAALQIAGWGTPSLGGIISDMPESATVRVVAATDCEAPHASFLPSLDG